MAAIVNFVCIRIHKEIITYMKNKRIPEDLITGEFSVEDVLQCISIHKMYDSQEKEAAKQMLADYEEFVKVNYSNIEQQFKTEYASVLHSLKTEYEEFRFNYVMSKYRNNINPVTALYHETKAVLNHFNPDNETHLWLLDLLSDKEFIEKLLLSIDQDITSLNKIIKSYNWPLTTYGSSIPLELFHAKHLLADFKNYKEAFKIANIWGDE